VKGRSQHLYHVRLRKSTDWFPHDTASAVGGEFGFMAATRIAQEHIDKPHGKLDEVEV
jgi:hypothetical protein